MTLIAEDTDDWVRCTTLAAFAVLWLPYTARKIRTWTGFTRDLRLALRGRA